MRRCRSVSFTFSWSLAFPWPFAKRVGSIWPSDLSLVEKSRIARSSNVPPHFRPKANRANLRRSSPNEANSSQDEKAERSNDAPLLFKVFPVVSCKQRSEMVSTAFYLRDSLISSQAIQEIGRHQIAGWNLFQSDWKVHQYPWQA